MEVLEFQGPGEGRVKEVKVKPGSLLSFGKLILLYQVPTYLQERDLSVNITFPFGNQKIFKEI